MERLVRNIRWILVGSLALMLLAGLSVALMRARADRSGFALPFPDQVAAIVASVERTPPSERQMLLDALNSPYMHVALSDAPPPSAPGTVPMPGLELAVRAYLGVLGGRSLDTMVDATRGAGRVSADGRFAMATRPVRLVIGLRTGGYLVIDTRTALAERMTGVGFALALLAVTVIIAAAAMILVTRQLRPLMRLSAAVERFGSHLETSELPDDGAKEVRDLTAAFHLLQTRIRELVAGRTRMMAAIGHDLGTYLTRLRLRVDFIDDAEERLRAERDIADMQNLIAGTLTLARLDHDGEAPVKTDLAELLQRRAANFAAAGACVRFDGPLPVMAEVRPAAMARAFDNLISNALKYGGEADVAAHMVAGHCDITIADRGPGIPPEARAAVLEPFFRRDAARNLDEASFGLGLAIVAEILKRHGAGIAFEDRPGGGLVVRLRLDALDCGRSRTAAAIGA